MDALKLIKKSQKKSLKIIISSAEDILRSIISDISKFKDSLPENFNQVVPAGYCYGFFFLSYKTIFEEEKKLQKQIKKSLKNIFGRRQGNLMYDYAQLKKEDNYFKLGFELSKKDMKQLENFEDAINIISYYSGKINVNTIK